MSTTTIRISDTLKTRVAEAAERAGTSVHAFIVEAIVEKTEMERRRREIDDVAESRYAEIVASGKVIAWEEMRPYLLERAGGVVTRRPKAKKPAR